MRNTWEAATETSSVARPQGLHLQQELAFNVHQLHTWLYTGHLIELISLNHTNGMRHGYYPCITDEESCLPVLVACCCCKKCRSGLKQCKFILSYFAGWSNGSQA